MLPLLAAALAVAAPPRSPPRSPPTMAVRLGVGSPDLLELSLGAGWGPMQIEAGGTFLLAVLSGYARGGLQWILRDRRGEGGRGTTVGLSLLAEWRYLAFGAAGISCAGAGLELVGALEVDWWQSRRFGWSLELSAGGGNLQKRWSDPASCWRSDIPDARLSFGIKI